jgi:hypothetical protein
MRRVYGLLKEMDPNHPVFVVQAPRGTIEALRAYEPTYDITGADVYPISYPPGTHSIEANKQISMVGDFTQKMMKVAAGSPPKPVWMVLQITFSGTIKPGKQLRMPTFPETRFMTYQAIINGARGVKYFGGHIQKSMPPEDAKLGWHWGHWKRVLRPVIEEIGSKSELYPALLAPESQLGVKCATPGVEFCVREVGKEVFVLACKREGETVAAKFTGLPGDVTEGEVMYESPRRVEVKGGVLSDWFGPFEVHVYRFRRE